MLPPSQPMTMPPNQSSQQNPNMFMFPSTSMPSESFTALMSRNPSQMHHSMQMPMAMPMSLPMMPSHVHTTQSPTHNYSHAMALAVNLFANSSPATSSMGMPGRHTTHSTNMNMLPKMSTSLPRGSHVEENRTLVGHSTSSMDASLLQASLEHPEAPNLLKQYQLEWRNCNEKRRDIDNEPVSTIEKQLQPLIDSKCRVHSLVDVETFLAIVQAAKTETEQAFVLVILRATTQLASSASSEQKRLAKATARGFEKNGGLKLARSWIEKGVDNNHRDLLVLLLDVLRHLPLRLSSITDARINEPIVKLKKTARDEIVKKSAQELLKYWRARFTEKEMARTANLSSAKVSSELSNLSSSSPVGTSATSIPTAPRISHRPIASAKAISNSKAHLLSRDSAINLKKRAVKIKHLEQLPFNGGTSVSKTSSDLIDNLKQRNAVKEVTASTNSSTNSSKANNENAALNESCSAANENKSVTVPSDNNPKNEQDVAMQLPAIQSFGSVSKSVSKKIRWADEQGEELVRVQLIESWRDHLPSTAGMNDESFQHAKLREHADERNALQSQKQRVHIQATHEWYTPPLIQLPEAIATRLQSPVKTEEYKGQTARTRHEMEYLVLDGETPQASPKEWTRGVNERNQSGPPVPIPLSEIVHDDEGFPPTEERIGDGNEEHVTDNKTTLEDDDDRDYGEELEEEAALRDALGPLKRSTIALLIENEDSLPQICEEAQRNGNRISDARILDIIAGKQMRNHNGYSSMPHPPAGYYHTHGPPTVGYHPYAQGAISHRMPRPYPDQIPLKRKLPGSMGPNGGGILADAPPPFKRLMRKGPAALTCMYHYSPAGCKHGAGCQYSHDVPPGPYPQSLNEVHHPNNMNGMHPPISHFEPGRMGFQGPANHRQMRR